MNMREALRARLLAAAPIQALIGSRVYWVKRPQTSTLPAITLQVIDEPRDQHMEAFQVLQSALVQIDAWGERFSQVDAIREAVIAALTPAHRGNGIDFRRAFVRSRDLPGDPTPDGFVHRANMDFTVSYSVQGGQDDD